MFCVLKLTERFNDDLDVFDHIVAHAGRIK